MKRSLRSLALVALFAKHRIKDGIASCVKYTRDQNPWASQERTPELMKVLLSYGAHGKSVMQDIQRFPPFVGLDSPQDKALFSYHIGREEKLTSKGWVALQSVERLWEAIGIPITPPALSSTL